MRIEFLPLPPGAFNADRLEQLNRILNDLGSPVRAHLVFESQNSQVVALGDSLRPGLAAQAWVDQSARIAGRLAPVEHPPQLTPRPEYWLVAWGAGANVKVRLYGKTMSANDAKRNTWGLAAADMTALPIGTSKALSFHNAQKYREHLHRLERAHRATLEKQGLTGADLEIHFTR